jgi:uncharacterized protein DUF1698
VRPDLPFLPNMPLVGPQSRAEIEAALKRSQWFHKIDFGDLVSPGYDYDDNWNWVLGHLRSNAGLVEKASLFEHGPADGLWSCWLTKLGARDIVAADIVDREEYRLVIETFGLPVEYHPGLISTATPTKVRRLFDGVASLGVLYHVHDPLATLIMYQRYLRGGGFLLMETGSLQDDVPALYYTGESLIYGKEGGNQFIPSTGFLEESLVKGLGFEILAADFRRAYTHDRLDKEVGRSFVVAVKRGLPTIHSYPIVVEQLGMTGEDFGPIEWAYGPWPPGDR